MNDRLSPEQIADGYVIVHPDDPVRVSKVFYDTDDGNTYAIIAISKETS